MSPAEDLFYTVTLNYAINPYPLVTADAALTTSQSLLKLRAKIDAALHVCRPGGPAPAAPLPQQPALH